METLLIVLVVLLVLGVIGVPIIRRPRRRLTGLGRTTAVANPEAGELTPLAPRAVGWQDPRGSPFGTALGKVPRPLGSAGASPEAAVPLVYAPDTALGLANATFLLAAAH